MKLSVEPLKQIRERSQTKSLLRTVTHTTYLNKLINNRLLPKCQFAFFAVKGLTGNIVYERT